MKASSLLLSWLLSLILTPAFAAINLTNGDSAGGLNDPAPISPVGGNAAIHLGQARANVLLHALLTLDAQIGFNVPLSVKASFKGLGGTSSTATLGYATAESASYNFPGATYLNTLYPIALANHLAGKDLAPSINDITLAINGDVDTPAVLAQNRWYYGFDHRTTTSTLDLLSTIRHELFHGLGFFTYMISDGSLPPSAPYPDIFMHFMAHSVNGQDITYTAMLTNTQRAAGLTDPGNLHWTGPATRNLAIGWLTAGTATDGDILLYAPTTYQAGSSVSHFDTRLTPDELMEPYDTPTTDDRLAMAALRDMGWRMNNPAATLPSADLRVTVSSYLVDGVEISIRHDGPQPLRYIFLTQTLPTSIFMTADSPQSPSLQCYRYGSFSRCVLQNIRPYTIYQIRLHYSEAVQTRINVSAPYSDPRPLNNTVNLTFTPAGGGGGGSAGPIWLLLLLYGFFLEKRRKTRCSYAALS